jgi:tripartite-type tricarboxylate transporter receptor subunit TctC
MGPRWLAALIAALALPGLSLAQAACPNKPVRPVVPFPAGGATDLLVRSIAQRMGQGLAQTVVVENKAGAGGTLGWGEVAKAAPDGYTILIATSSTHAIAPHLNPNLPYKVDADFTPIAHVANAPNVVPVPLSLPVANMQELIAYAKTHPGQLNHASSGNGTIVHLTSESFKSQAGVYITHIPYRGTALSIPDLPTVAESGLPGFESTTWFGIYGPKGLPAEVTHRLNAAFNAAMKSADVQERLARLGAEPAPPNTPAQFAALVQADSARWAQLILERKISAQ